MCRSNPPLTPPRRGTKIRVSDNIRGLVLQLTAPRQFPSFGGVRGGSSVSSQPAARNLDGWLTSRPATFQFFCANPFFDSFDYRTDIVFHVVIPKAQMRDAERFDFLVSLLIFLSRVVVNRTVHVHGQRQLFGIKVHDPAPERFLPIKVVAPKLLSLDLFPKQNFSKRHFSTKLAGALCEIRTGRNNWSCRLHLGRSITIRANPPLTPPRRGAGPRTRCSGRALGSRVNAEGQFPSWEGLAVGCSVIVAVIVRENN